MKYTEDKHLKILLVLLFGLMNVGLVSLLAIIILEGSSKEEITRLILGMLIVIFMNYAALQVFSDG